jgi:hypothetical protein
VGAVLAVASRLALTTSAVSEGNAATAPSATHGSVAGYGVQNIGAPEVTVRSAVASWIEPMAIPRGYHDAYSVAYLGFNDIYNDGAEYNEPQLGTEANTIGGKTQYFAWYSPPSRALMCTADNDCQPVRLRESVLPGDHMATSISCKGTRFTLKITDVRYRKHHAPERWTRTIRLYDSDARPAGMSVGVSWLVDSAGDVQPLAEFSAIHFAHVDVDGYVIGSYLPDSGTQYTLEGGEGALATSSALNRTGDGFIVTWKHAGP